MLSNPANLQLTNAAFEKGSTSGDFFPSYYGIEVTRRCNLACVMCPHPTYPAADRGHMDFELFRRVVIEIAPYAELVRLHWVGEPLLHPDIVELIKFARSNLKAALHLSTNATLLRGELSEQIRTAGLDKIILSLDGMSAETYENIRLKGRFKTVMQNIESFVQSVETNGGPLCELQMIVTKTNEHEAELFTAKWKRYKCAAVNVTWLTDWAGNIPNRDALSSAKNPVQLRPRQPCSDLWFKMQVSWTGEVNLCCLDAKRSVSFGNIRDRSLREIWQSTAAQDARRQHLKRNYAGICARCSDWAQPQEYEFWYSREQYQMDPNGIWSAPPLNLTST